ncbi:MAG: DUF1844 domain-containing protein, partial [Thermodesulfobacteriota bacterium]|nr:DUF1844 domain-containing protein [Thermodesulfobacteriota bacterium]
FARYLCHNPMHHQLADGTCPKPLLVLTLNKVPSPIGISEFKEKKAMNHSEGEDFKVTDKGHSAEKGSDQKDSSDSKSSESKKFDSAQLPNVNFSTFLFSLNTSAMVHLGEIPEFGSGKTKKDFILAQYTIDTLAMLQEKTVGNLTEDEKSFLEHILYDLRMRYIKAIS